MGRFKFDVDRLAMGQCVGKADPAHLCAGFKRAHHAIKQQTLRELYLDVWDPAIGVLICDGLHVRHHDASDFKIPLEWLPARNLDFAESHGIRHRLEKEHPSLFPADGV